MAKDKDKGERVIGPKELQAQKDSIVKKINQRYIEICREFGPNSGIAKDYHHTMEIVAGSDNIRVISSTTSKKAPKNNPSYITGKINVEQIKRDKKTLDKIDIQELNALLNKHTAGDIKKSAKEEAKRQSEETGDNISMQQVIEDMDYVYDFLDEHGYDSNDSTETKNAFDFYWDSVGHGAPRPTYSELRRIMEMQKITKDLIDQGKTEEAANLQNGVAKTLSDNHRRDIFGGL